MKRIALILALAAPSAVAFAQTAPAPKPATAKPATSTAAKTTTGTRTGAASAYGPKLPPGVPPARGLVKSAFALKYQDIKVGTGALAEPNKLYEVHYTGWLASDGTKFDSSYDHRSPVLDKDGKPENDADGKPKLGEPQPLTFPQGFGKLIPGWDQGFEGMHVGGKRRLFIPYQLAYGANGRPPKIPAKSDLIFDVELVSVKDLPMRPGMPGGLGTGNGRPMPPRPGMPGTPGAAPSPGSAPAPGTPPPSPTPSTTPKPVDPAQPTPGTPAPTTVPSPAPPPAPNATPNPPTSTTPDKPANPAQPNK